MEFRLLLTYSLIVVAFMGIAVGRLPRLAMASTFAGNLTLLGSVANLIVAEQGKRSGIKIGFLDYLKVGLPVTILSVIGGTAWLAFILKLGGTP